MIAAGLGLLGMSPSDFWAMTPRELAAALRGRLGLDGPVTPIMRNDFESLMQRFPDQE
ncbi:MAG: phage tail assembly chaperone [Alphaproteobacteria bacterium]|nr:phage tail assembly chaperone [Alphaproteobacteria bacterium]